MRPSDEASEDPHGRPASLSVATQVVPLGGDGPERGRRTIAVEEPVNVVYGPLPYAVMMATPADLVDFAYGFSLTEGVVRNGAEIRSVALEPGEGGLRLLVDLVPERMHAQLAGRRAMSGRTGCGICGIDDLASLPQAPARRGGAAAVSVEAVRRALAGLELAQDLNAETRAVHAAAFADLEGRIRLVREDVGRHNALDKVAGAMMREALDPAAGFLVITSRCSFEMVEKAAVLGVSTLVAISAPTSLALERARLHDITLVAIARRDSVTVFTGGLRIEEPVT